MNAIERAEKVKNRTCKPNWKGLRFIKGNHYNNENITDAEAIKLLRAGLLQHSDFEVLPEGLVIKNYSKQENTEAKRPQPTKRKNYKKAK